MSTSIYANVKLVGDETTPEIRMHLGKTGSNIVIVDGNSFPTFQSMIDFLTHNEERVTIESEYGVTMSVEEFVNEMRSYDKVARARQYRMATGGNVTIDPEGFTMSTGVWF